MAQSHHNRWVPAGSIIIDDLQQALMACAQERKAVLALSEAMISSLRLHGTAHKRQWQLLTVEQCDAYNMPAQDCYTPLLHACADAVAAHMLEALRCILTYSILGTAVGLAWAHVYLSIMSYQLGSTLLGAGACHEQCSESDCIDAMSVRKCPGVRLLGGYTRASACGLTCSIT